MSAKQSVEEMRVRAVIGDAFPLPGEEAVVASWDAAALRAAIDAAVARLASFVVRQGARTR